MTNSILAVLCAAVFVWLVTAMREKRLLGTTYPQAFNFTLFRFLFGINVSGLPPASELRGPLVFVINEQSRFDRALLRSLLPVETYHLRHNEIQGHGFQLMISVLKGGGIVCLYLPKEGEASSDTRTLLGEIAGVCSDVSARIRPVFIRGTRHCLLSNYSRQEAPRSILPQINIAAGAEINPAASPERRHALDILDGLAMAKFTSTSFDLNFFESLVAAARLYGPGREILLDALGAKMSYRKMLIGVRALAVRFAPMDRDTNVLGLLLPNTSAVTMAFTALMSAGRIPAMLNYTAGSAAILSACRTAGLRNVITSRAFIEKMDLGDLVERLTAEGYAVHYLEDIRKSLTWSEKLDAFLYWRWPLARSRVDSPAVILFTSGSEGAPKGVVLSSRNLLANAAQAECRIDISPADTLLNVLPVFHSFGLLGGMLLPLLYGVRLYLYPSPLHYRLIPGVARKLAPTIMFGTDTFLNGYGRTADNDDFKSLRLIVAGAEPVRPETRTLYRERFSAEIVEGYGMTEAAPVVAVNSTAMQKEGSVGRLLPGMTMKLEPVEGIEDGGRLHIAGPNVMLGYLRAERPGVIEALSGVWHDSGDIVSVDTLGYLTILGRVKRFAKIAGEMISLGAVEMLATDFWPEDDHAAVALPDKRKGERIVLVTTKSPAMIDELRAFSRRYGASELMVPNDIVSVEELPVLGSGKIDYVSAREIAETKTLT